MQPVKAVKQGIQIYFAEIIFGDRAVLAVLGDLACTDAITGFQIVGAKPVGGCFFR